VGGGRAASVTPGLSHRSAGTNHRMATISTIGPTTTPLRAGDDGTDRRSGATLEFPFAFDPAFRILDLPFGIVPSRTGVTIDDDRLTARFGSWEVSTPLANVLSAEVTGPYSLLRVAVGPRLSLSDRGLTFATTTRAGVCIRFVRPVRGLDPTGHLAHPTLTVTVADAAALAELLTLAGNRHGAARVIDEPVPVAELAQEVTDELTGLSAAELRTRARELGIPRVSTLRKAELLELLRVPQPASS